MLIEDITGGEYQVIEEPGFTKDYKKWAKKRRGAKGKENPVIIFRELKKELERNPKDAASPFEFHKLNKSRKAVDPEWSAKLSHKTGERALYTVDEVNKIVYLTKVREHNKVYSSQEFPNTPID